MVQHHARGGSCGSSNEQGRGEYASRSAGSKGQRRRQKLAENEQQQHVQRKRCAAQNVLNRCVANALEIVVAETTHHGVHQAAHHEHSQHMLYVVSALDTPLKKRLTSIDGLDEEGGNQACYQSQPCEG